MQLNVHQENYKKGDISGIEGEQKRLLKKYHDEVDLSRSNENTVVNYISDARWRKIIAERVKTHESISGKKIRKDANLLCSIVSSVPRSWGKEKITQYFTMQNELTEKLLKRYGLDDNCKLSSITHYDEPNSNPHNTFTYMPIHDGKFNRKAILKREFFSELQELQWNCYLEFAKANPKLEIMASPKFENGRRHLNEAQYKTKTLHKKISRLESEIVDKQYQSKVQDSYIKAKKEMISELDNNIATKKNELSVVYDKVVQGQQNISKVNEIVAEKEKYIKQLDKLSEQLHEEVVGCLDSFNSVQLEKFPWTEEEYDRVTDTEYKVSEKGNVFIPKSIWEKVVEFLNRFFEAIIKRSEVQQTVKSIATLEKDYKEKVNNDSINKRDKNKTEEH